MGKHHTYPRPWNSYQYYVDELKKTEIGNVVRRIGLLIYPGWQVRGLMNLLNVKQEIVKKWVDSNECFPPPHYAEMISRLARERAVMLNEAATRLDEETKARMIAKANLPPLVGRFKGKISGSESRMDMTRAEF